MTNKQWDFRFLKLAKECSEWSKDPSTKVGAVIADKNNRIVSIGYNGFPRGIEDTDERLNNRELKYKIVLHAEENALLFANRTDFADCTVYLYPLPPCSNCVSRLIQAGITRVVIPKNYKDNGLDFDLSFNLLVEANIDFSSSLVV